MEVETEYWRVEFTTRPPGTDFEDDNFDEDMAAAMARMEAGEDWESVIDDLSGREGKLA